MYWFSILARCLVSLYDGAFMLWIAGRNGMSVSCNFSCAFSVGSEGFFWVRYFIFYLFMITLHSCIVLCRSFWYLSVGSLGNTC